MFGATIAADNISSGLFAHAAAELDGGAGGAEWW